MLRHKEGRLVDGVLVFEGESYTDNFGWQWNEHDSTQLDSENQDTLSLDRLLLSLGVSREDLKGKWVLETGCGAGRFTEQLLACGANVAALDSSSAVHANARRNACDRAIFVLASIYSIPFEPKQFDIVLCLGVLQHTPDRAKTIQALAEQVKPGGMLCVDSYQFTVRRLFPSYLLRPLWARLPSRAAQMLSRGYVNCWWPFRKVFRAKWARAAAWALSPIAPVCYYWSVSKNKSDEFLKDWAYLETHDFITPKHDVPQTEWSLKRKFKRAGLTRIDVRDLSKVPVNGRVVSGFYVGRGYAP